MIWIRLRPCVCTIALTEDSILFPHPNCRNPPAPPHQIILRGSNKTRTVPCPRRGASFQFRRDDYASVYNAV